MIALDSNINQDNLINLYLPPFARGGRRRRGGGFLPHIWVLKPQKDGNVPSGRKGPIFFSFFVGYNFTKTQSPLTVPLFLY